MIKRFLSYVEIRTKITSIFAFLMTIAYLMYRHQPVRWGLTALFFASMFLFDLTTTAINNYMDTKTNRQKLQFSRKTSLAIIYTLFLISTALGLALAWKTGLVVLLLGGLCFLCGVFYTYGPVPISRQPLGEILSGLFYGLLIPFILLYINMPQDTYLTLGWDAGAVTLRLQVLPLFTVALLSASPVCATANIMLANNICDLSADIAVRRHTLPYYLGVRPSLYLFAGLYYAVYFFTALMVAFRMLSPVSLLLFVTLPPVQRNITLLFRKQEKATTFGTAIRNYVILMSAQVVLILIGALL